MNYFDFEIGTNDSFPSETDALNISSVTAGSFLFDSDNISIDISDFSNFSGKEEDYNEKQLISAKKVQIITMSEIDQKDTDNPWKELITKWILHNKLLYPALSKLKVVKFCPLIQYL
jgi:hypothetical protein